jgi:hypothetical protein
VFLPLPKPHQRLDELNGYGRDLFNDFLNQAATHKSFEAFVECFNMAQEFESKVTGRPVLLKLSDNAFRNSWFFSEFLDKTAMLGRNPGNLLLFTKREFGGHGLFEDALEDINGPLSQAFTSEWATHLESRCKINHKVLVGDGHMKTKFDTCDNKTGATLVHSTLGNVQLSCSRWPAHIGGKKLKQCFQCLSQTL